MEVRAEQTLLATLGEVERGHATTESFLPLLAIWHVKSKQITPNLWQNITTYYWLFHPHIPISIPMEISATEVIYCTYMFSDKLLLAFGFNTSKYQQIGENQDQPLKSYMYRLKRWWNNWDVIFHTTWEGRSTCACISNSDAHFFFPWSKSWYRLPRSEIKGNFRKTVLKLVVDLNLQYKSLLIPVCQRMFKLYFQIT